MKRNSATRNLVSRNLVTPALLFAFVMAMMVMTWSKPSMAQIAVGISVRIGPPALPVYEQPVCPGAGYLWTPGYWAWSDDDGYYWVPGTWVEAPVGLLWTPGWWGWNNGFYAWNAGYWGPQVGFYGGINYGYGYGGNGFYGGEWRGGTLYYNRAVWNVGPHITNVYVNKTVIVNNNSHVAFNGGQGGVQVRPTPQQEAYEHEQHRAALPAQVQHEHAASQNRALFARENHGRPPIAATARPGDFSHGVVAAKAAGGTYHEPKISPKEARGPARPESKETAKGNAKPTPANRNKPARPEHAAESKASHAPAKSSEHAKNEARPAKEAAPARSEARPAKEAAPARSAARPAKEAKPPNETRARNESRPAPEARPKSEPRSEPKSEPRSEPKSEPRASAPKAAPHREAAPKRESPPKEEKHPGK